MTSYRRTGSDKTRNARAYKITASWDARPDRPAVRKTQDRRAARRVARELAEQGAYVLLEVHDGYERWRTLEEIDGPALVAERVAAEQAAAEAEARARLLAEEQARAVEAERRRRHRLAAEVATHVRELMAPPAIVRPEHRRQARHVTGGQR